MARIRDRQSALYDTLSPSERNRAERFRRAADRERFVVTRGMLRGILGAYLGVPARSIRFGYGQWGKPFLDPMEHSVRLSFNVSHSGGIALCAVAQDRRVGVDIELQQVEFDWQAVAGRFFSIREIDAISSLPRGRQGHGFYRCWVRKEAYLKAVGQGLSSALKEFDVSHDLDSAAGLLQIDSGAAEAHSSSDRSGKCWQIRDIFAGTGYAAATAAEGDDWQMINWDGAGLRIAAI